MAPSRRRLAAFTLIELLVVIAIIAILTAILLPVFASVREGSRQGVAISNMHDIQSKMEQFKLDNHKYPDVLFGYYFPNGTAGSTMATGLSLAQAADKANNTNYAPLYFPGLYPAYIKDPNVFTDPNNTVEVGDTPANTPPLTDAYVIAPCNPANDNTLRGDTASMCGGSNPPPSGQAVQTHRTFYKADAYDSSLQVTGGNQLDPTKSKFLIRYQTARELLAGQGQYNTPDPDYNRQLRWRNPPADTIVTLTPYHVGYADKVLVLFESGTVEKVKAEDFLHDIGGQDAIPGSTFWKIKP